MSFCRALGISAALALLASSALAEEKTLLFTGTSLEEDSHYSYVGGVYAPLSSLSANGLLVRGTAAYGGYGYDRTGAADVDGTVRAFDLMAGYQYFISGGARFSFYAGLDYQNHDLSPDDLANPVRGTEFGAKGQLEFYVPITPNVDASIVGSYSTAFDSYWSRATIAYDFGFVAVGPEVLLMGSQSYDQQRYGIAFSKINLGDVAEFGFSGGYSNTSDRGKDGAYLELRLSTQF